VRMFDSLMKRGMLAAGGDGLTLSKRGARFVTEFGVDLGALRRTRRPLCRTCLDWSARRHHLAGVVGARMLDRLYELGWAKRRRGTRIVDFTPRGEREFRQLFA